MSYSNETSETNRYVPYN